MTTQKRWAYRYQSGAFGEVIETGPASFLPAVLPASKNRTGSGLVLPACATLEDAIRAADESAGEESSPHEWALSA